MLNELTISLGDNVRVRAHPVTERLGLVGVIGNVYGETTPSVTSVEVIGVLKEDYAVNVFFDERQQAYWFAPELLEFVDHAPGAEITIAGVPKKWVRAPSGEWIESDEETGSVSKPW